MNATAYTALVILALILLWFEQVWVAFVVLFAVVVLFLHSLGAKSVKATKAVGKSLATGIGKEVEESEGSHPDEKIVSEVLGEAGKRVGEQLAAGENYSYQAPKISGRIGKGAKSVIDLFKRLFP